MNRKRINTKNQLVCRTDSTIKLMTEEVNCEYNLSNNQTVIGYNIGSNEQYFINKKDNEVINTTLHFNPIASKVKASSSIPADGTMSTYLYFDKEGIQKVGINKEVIAFNNAIDKRSCTNPSRVINEKSFKTFNQLYTKTKAITSVKINIQDDSISSFVKDSYNKIYKVKLDAITVRLERIKNSKTINDLIEK